MSQNHVLILVDGREVVVLRQRLLGRTVLAAVGADEDRGDMLIREDAGLSNMVGGEAPVDIEVAELAIFRVLRGHGTAPELVSRGWRTTSGLAGASGR